MHTRDLMERAKDVINVLVVAGVDVKRRNSMSDNQNIEKLE